MPCPDATSSPRLAASRINEMTRKTSKGMANLKRRNSGDLGARQVREFGVE